MKVKISELQREVLDCLVSAGEDDYGGRMCLYFSSISKRTGLDKRRVRLACRALTRKGLAEYVRGLFDEEGYTAGSGYCATDFGIKLIIEPTT